VKTSDLVNREVLLSATACRTPRAFRSKPETAAGNLNTESSMRSSDPNGSKTADLQRLGAKPNDWLRYGLDETGLRRIAGDGL
jgi:hypothetical protein